MNVAHTYEIQSTSFSKYRKFSNQLSKFWKTNRYMRMFYREKLIHFLYIAYFNCFWFWKNVALRTLNAWIIFVLYELIVFATFFYFISLKNYYLREPFLLVDVTFIIFFISHHVYHLRYKNFQSSSKHSKYSFLQF